MRGSDDDAGIAFRLPQFHPIAENGEWVGKRLHGGTNAVNAKPLFNGHYQPHFPADLGFYDLHVPKSAGSAGELAKANEISGLCYYRYWFRGRRLLARPIDEILSTGRPDFLVCAGQTRVGRGAG